MDEKPTMNEEQQEKRVLRTVGCKNIHSTIICSSYSLKATGSSIK